MPVKAKRPKPFEVPKPGTYPAINVDVNGFREPDTFNPGCKRDAVEFTWQLEEENSKGSRFFVTKTYTNSLHEKSKLREHLESWLGRPLSQQEVQSGDFDLESFLGQSCLLNISQTESAKGAIYAKVNSVAALPKGMAPLKATTYIRKCHRPGYIAPPDDDESPF